MEEGEMGILYLRGEKSIPADGEMSILLSSLSQSISVISPSHYPILSPQSITPISQLISPPFPFFSLAVSRPKNPG